jgi:peptidoglycan/LPS O-acetylase OafA/YrhL
MPALVWGRPDWSFAVGALDWNFPVWSLGAEAFFYLLFPFVAPRLVRVRIRVLVMMLGACWLLAVIPPLAYPRVVPGASYPMDHAIPAWSWVINYTPLFRLPEFLFGIVLGHLYCRYRPVGGSPSLRVRLAGSLAATVALGLLLFCFVTLRDEPGLLLANGLFDPLFGVLIFGLAVSNLGLAWLLARPPLLLLGEASYALYVLHIPLWIVLVGWAPSWVSGPATSGSHVWVVGYLMLAICVGVAVFLWLERPARRWLRQALAGEPGGAGSLPQSRPASGRSSPELTTS